METLHSIDLRLAERLKDSEFRREWFRAELEVSVPELFRDMREERKKTQSQLAEMTGMKQSAICRFERSRDAKWKLETLLTLAEALDVQLVISIRRAEDIISYYEQKETSGAKGPLSVLSEVESQQFNQDRNGPLLSQKERTTDSRIGPRGSAAPEDKPWN